MAVLHHHPYTSMGSNTLVFAFKYNRYLLIKCQVQKHILRIIQKRLMR